MTCPPFSPPGLFDLTAPNNPVVVWLFWAVLFFYLASLFFVFRQTFRRIPPGPARRSMIWLQCLQSWCMGLFLFLSGVNGLWINALNRWSSSLPDTCYNSVRPAYFDLAYALQMMTLISAVGSFIVSFMLLLRIIARYQRLRAALRPVTP